NRFGEQGGELYNQGRQFDRQCGHRRPLLVKVSSLAYKACRFVFKDLKMDKVQLRSWSSSEQRHGLNLMMRLFPKRVSSSSTIFRTDDFPSPQGALTLTTMLLSPCSEEMTPAIPFANSLRSNRSSEILVIGWSATKSIGSPLAEWNRSA